MGFLSGCAADVKFAPGLLNSSEKSSACGTSSTPCPVNAQTINESYQVPKSPVKADILFVVDGTPRMFNTITKLQTRMQGFLDSLAGADYQAGIMNSSMGSYDAQSKVFPIAGLMPLNPFPTDISGPLTIVTNDVRNSDWILGRNLNFNGLSLIMNQNTDNQDACTAQPYCAVGSSQPLNAIKSFIQNKTANAGFFRPGAMFVPVIISAGDENDGGTPAAMAADVESTFSATFGETAGGLRAYSVIVKPGDSSCLDQYSSIFKMGSGGAYGAQLDQFAQTSGGASVSICGSDYTSGLSAITKGFSSNISAITLQQRPLDGTLKIVSVPAADLQYTVSGTTVTFAQPLPWGATISISYQVKPE